MRGDLQWRGGDYPAPVQRGGSGLFCAGIGSPYPAEPAEMVSVATVADTAKSRLALGIPPVATHRYRHYRLHRVLGSLPNRHKNLMKQCVAAADYALFCVGVRGAYPSGLQNAVPHPNQHGIWTKLCLILTALACPGLAFSSPQATQICQLFNGPITAYLVGIFWLIALIYQCCQKPPLQWLGVLALIARLATPLGTSQVQTIAKTNALQNPYHFDWTADHIGGLGIVSIFGLTVLVSVVVWQLI